MLPPKFFTIFSDVGRFEVMLQLFPQFYLCNLVLQDVAVVYFTYYKRFLATGLP